MIRVFYMQRVLVVSNNLQQGNYSPSAFKFDQTVHVTKIDARQINARRLSKSLKALRRTDLIILQDSICPSERSPSKGLLSSLEATGIPIVVLPETIQKVQNPTELKVLNWQGQSRSRPELASLLAQIRSQYTTSINTVTSSQKNVKASLEAAVPVSTPGSVETAARHRSTQPLHQQIGALASYGKVASTLTAVRRISGQLREPLSNMNLAIHMLGQVRSPTDQERYIRLLREEYNRELQLLNQLDSYLQADLPAIPPPANKTS